MTHSSSTRVTATSDMHACKSVCTCHIYSESLGLTETWQCIWMDDHTGLHRCAEGDEWSDDDLLLQPAVPRSMAGALAQAQAQAWRPEEGASLPEAVFQALGTASTCWEDTPEGRSFDSARAAEVGEGLLAYLEEVVLKTLRGTV